MPYPPVYSFGDPAGKPVILIGLNPSRKEFEERKGKRFLSVSENANDRRSSQQSYFDRKLHTYFKNVGPFFDGPAKKKLRWTKTPWEKVGVLDLVKCATVTKDGQWNELRPSQKNDIIKECEGYLLKQLKLYRPRIVIPYGKSVCEWFEKYSNDSYEEYTTFEANIDGESIRGHFVPQRQGPHSKPEIEWVQKELALLL